MVEQLKIFTKQLIEGQHEKMQVTLPPDFLDLPEKDLKTPSPVAVEVQAYVVDELLMLSLNLSTEIEMLCSICNGPTRVPLQSQNTVISLPLSELASSVYDCTDLVREEIVMLIPQFVECKKGVCPERKALQPFLKKDKKNFPFANLH